MVTIKDIANQAGVSVSTVSRVINNRRDVSRDAKEKVQSAIKKLNYVPNGSARDLASIQSDTIGLIMRGIGNPFFSELYTQIEEHIRDTKYQLAINQIPSTADEIQAAAELARSKRLSGLILMGGNFTYTSKILRKIDVPFVCCTFSNVFGSLDKGEFSSVSIDDEKEAYKAVDYLIKNGHRKIAILLAATDDQSISELRYKGYLRALHDHHIAENPSLIQRTKSFDLADAYQATQELLEREKDFTAIFAISDIIGMAAIKALSDAGCKVPEDKSIIAIDGLRLSAFSIPTLTSLRQPKEEIGRKSVELLMDLMQEQTENKQIFLETELRSGHSVRPINSD